MKLPKIDWLTVASFAFMIAGGIVGEIQHQKDMEEMKGELKQYVDNGCVETEETQDE